MYKALQSGAELLFDHLCINKRKSKETTSLKKEGNKEMKEPTRSGSEGIISCEYVMVQ